jgi:hypothetical protein
LLPLALDHGIGHAYSMLVTHVMGEAFANGLLHALID